MKVKISGVQRELYSMYPEGKAYLEYNDKVGGGPIGLVVPYGYPQGVDEMGGPIAVYQECIKQKKTWQELLGINDQINKDIIV